MKELVPGYVSIVPVPEYDPKDTVMDIDVFGTGKYISLGRDSLGNKIYVEFMGRLVNTIYVLPTKFRPSVKDASGQYYILHPLTRAYDGIIKVILNDAGQSVLQKAVSRLQREVDMALTGKKGLFTRHVMGVRMPFSGRAIAGTSLDLNISESEVGVPHKIMKKMQSSDNHIGLLLRNPILHKFSILGCRMVGVDGSRILIHPSINEGLGCDFDGDMLCVIAIKDKDVAKYVYDHMLYHRFLDDMRKPFKNEFELFKHEEDKIANESYNEIAERMHGWTIHLSDIEDDTYIAGLISDDDFYKAREDAQASNIQVKVAMGVAGQFWLDAMSLALNVGEKELIVKICEAISQSNLHSKHGSSINVFYIIKTLGKMKEDTSEYISEMLYQSIASDTISKQDVNEFCNIILRRDGISKSRENPIYSFCLSGSYANDINKLENVSSNENICDKSLLHFMLSVLKNHGFGSNDSFKLTSIIDDGIAKSISSNILIAEDSDIPDCWGTEWHPERCRDCIFCKVPVEYPEDKRYFCKELTELDLLSKHKIEGGGFLYPTSVSNTYELYNEDVEEEESYLDDGC